MSSPAAGGGPAPRPAPRPKSSAEKALIVGTPEWVAAKEAEQAARNASEKATVPAPAAPEHYVPPNVMGKAADQMVDGTTFYPGLSGKEVRAIFGNYVKKERDYQYNTKEQLKRAQLLINMPPFIKGLQNNYPHLVPLIPTEIMSMIIPKDGWQSCDYAKLIDLSTGILAARLNHLNTWFETNPIPDSFVAAIQARTQRKEEADAAAAKVAAENAAREESVTAELAFLRYKLAEAAHINAQANAAIMGLLPHATIGSMLENAVNSV